MQTAMFLFSLLSLLYSLYGNKPLLKYPHSLKDHFLLCSVCLQHVMKDGSLKARFSMIEPGLHMDG